MAMPHRMRAKPDGYMTEKATAEKTETRQGPGADGDEALWLSAIIENSFDAILSKSLDGIITSWNGAAERLFGYLREEAVGKSITLIIPEDRLHEEEDILARLRRGERIERFETIRRGRDGQLIDIEITVSPVRNEQGHIIGVSKVARDISERRRQSEAQSLLLREMNHRIKNLMTILQSLIAVGRRRSESVDDFAERLSTQLQTLAAAHQLVLGDLNENTTLEDVLHAILAPYGENGTLSLKISDTPVASGALTSLALIFHELATNAVKYGGLSHPGGKLTVESREEGDHVTILWREIGGLPPPAETAPQNSPQGFGTRLLQSAIQGLHGRYSRHWRDGVFEISLSFPIDRLCR